MLKDLRAKGPRSVALMLTTRCNLRCAYCYQDRTASRSMGLGVLEAAVDRCLRSDWGNPELTLFGGEPLVEKPLVWRAIELVRAATATASEIRPDVRMFTNGLLLDPETARLLVNADVHITLSIDGLPGAQDLRGPGSFQALDRMLLRFREDHPDHFRSRLAVSSTLTSANVSYLASSFRYFVARGVSEIRVNPVITNDPDWGSSSRDELDRQLANVVEASLKVQACSGEIPFLAFQSSTKETSPQAQASRLCGTANRKELFVDVDGSLAPCAVMAGSSVRHTSPLLRDTIESLGAFQLTDPDLEEKLAAREQKVQDLSLFTGKTAKRSSFGPCVDCPALGNCFICPMSIAFCAEDMDSDEIPAIQCDFNRLVERHRAAFHCAIRARSEAGTTEPVSQPVDAIPFPGTHDS